MKATILKLKREIALRLPGTFLFIQKGICPCCCKETTFFARDTCLREYFYCLKCGCIPRERAITVTLMKLVPNYADLSIHESSPMKRGLSVLLKENCKKYTETQFYPNIPLGQFHEGFRNENLEQQTFDDASFDLVITQDVFEHIYNPEKAFAEIARTLKPGGMHIFTIPFENNHKPSQKWAYQGTDGKPIFLNEPEWHGNPIDESGSPVTMHWGYDIVDFIKQASGMETQIIKMSDLSQGIFGDSVEVCVSIKK